MTHKTFYPSYSRLLQEAVQCLSLIYLKHFGYAFQGKSSQADPAHSVLATPSSFPTGSPPRGGRCGSPLDPVRSRKRRRPRKRLREEDQESASSPGAKRARCSPHAETVADSGNPLDLSLPSDSILFQSSQEDARDGKTIGEETKGLDSESGVHGDPDKLHSHYGKTRRGRVHYLSIRLTIGLVYLGLLFSEQKVLLAEFARYVCARLGKVVASVEVEKLE